MDLFMFLLLFYFGITNCRTENVPIRSQSLFAEDITSITHSAYDRLVTIELSPTRRCENPTFVVRLSGTALYKLKMVKQLYVPAPHNRTDFYFTARRNIIFFEYPTIVDAGTYHLEVMMLFCSTFDPLNYENICVEHRNHRIVTAPFSVKLSTDSQSPHPRWVLRNSVINMFEPKPLPTRYQDRFCIGSRPCTGIPDGKLGRTQHLLYDWVGAPSWTTEQHNLPNRKVHVCFVGASHARELTMHSIELVKPIAPNLVFHHLDAKLPTDFKLSQLETGTCDYAILSFGQWSNNKKGGKPCNAECFRESMKSAMALVNPRTYQGPTKVYFLSTNYNGLSSVITACPPYDHRFPPVIDMMNSITMSMAIAEGIPYIDTNHIMGPMWDSALDYNHPVGKVFYAEVEWILYSMFN